MSCDASGKYFFIFVLFLILFPTISHSFWDFPGGPVDNAPPSNTGNTIPGWGAKIPLVSGPKNQSVIPKQYCNKFKKDFKKNGPHQKILRKKKPTTPFILIFEEQVTSPVFIYYTTVLIIVLFCRSVMSNSLWPHGL